MTRTYSVLQYMPDLRRRETVNIGLVIFDGPTVRVVADLALIRSRLKCIAPAMAERPLAGFIDHLRHLETAEAVRAAIKKNTNIIPTEELWVSADQPLEACEALLWKLTVKPPSRPSTPRPRASLRKALDAVLRDLDGDQRIYRFRNIGPIERPDLFGIHDILQVGSIDVDPFDLVIPNSGRVIGARAFLASSTTRISEFSEKAHSLRNVKSAIQNLEGDKVFLPGALIVPNPDQAKALSAEGRHVIRTALQAEVSDEFIFDLAEREDRVRLSDTAREFAQVH